MFQYDSRKVQKKDTFIDLSNNPLYVKEAIQRGAKKVIVREGVYSVPTQYVSNTREYFRNYLKRYYYKKIKDLTLIGITGTNGKTTTAFLLYQALNRLGKKAAYIGTLGFYYQEIKKELQNTTPDLGELYEMLIECKNNGISYVIMEVSSQALSMHRVDGLLFDYVLFTNISQDHLDYHKTMENYVKEKQKLFAMVKKNSKEIVNIDDAYKKYFLKDTSITYGFKKSDYIFKIKEQDLFKTIFSVNNILYEMHLIGKYNVYNMGVVILVLQEMQFPTTQIQKVIPLLNPPKGRGEKIPYRDNQIIIDYAHTPDAVEKILKTVLDLPVHNVFTVLGCGGNRDQSKRPIMGAIAAKYSNYVFFTSDNPRDEDPNAILAAMVKNIETKNYEIIVNRKIAIEKAIQTLTKNDILLVLGKGHENYQVIQKEKIYFSDYDTIIEAIRR